MDLVKNAWWGVTWNGVELALWDTRLSDFKEYVYGTLDPELHMEQDEIDAKFAEFLNNHPEVEYYVSSKEGECKADEAMDRAIANGKTVILVNHSWRQQVQQ